MTQVFIGKNRAEKGITQPITSKKDNEELLILGSRHLGFVPGDEDYVDPLRDATLEASKYIAAGSFVGADDYAKATSFTPKEPAYVNIPLANVIVQIPVTDNTQTIEQVFERGTDFLADLLNIDGVEETLLKHGVKITPI
jgi:hypothetical protein